jgi:hypothetical protein
MNPPSLLSRPSREEIAQREIGHTDISRGTAWMLITTFLLTIAGPPIAQLAYDLTAQQGPDRQRAQEHSKIPSSLQLVTTLPTVVDAFRAQQGRFTQKLLAANRQLLDCLHAYERQLEERSLLTQRLLGPTRMLLAKRGGVGSEQVEIGCDGRLFFRPDIDYLTGPGFLEPRFRQRHAQSAAGTTSAIQPDPRTAIIEFHQQLAERGIRLVVMPTPGKPSVDPEQLSRRFTARPVTNNADDAVPSRKHQKIADNFAASIPLQNKSFHQFLIDLQREGVLVFDPAPVLAKFKNEMDNMESSLRTDTHWAPAAMEIVARELSNFIKHASLLPERPGNFYEQHAQTVTNLGDIASLLRLPPAQTLFPPETVTIHQIRGRAGDLWRAEPASDLLLLGDSFANIYSVEQMNWGVAAGLAEQLSFQLQRPVDCLTRNNGGAFAVRQALFQELARGDDRLAGKRVVVWQFATRELTSGDWQRQPMPTAAHPDKKSEPLPPGGEIWIQGTVRAAAGIPRPGTVPYRDAIMSVHLIDVQGQEGALIPQELIVYLWGLRDDQQTTASGVQPGQRITWRVIPWDQVKGQFERLNRMELDDPDLHLIDLPIYWSEH